MALTIQVPTVGLADSTEAVKVTNSLTNLSSWANGNIAGTDLSASANIQGSQISQTTGILHLAVRTPAGSITANVGDLVYAQPGANIGLPTAAVNAYVGVVASVSVTGALPVAVFGTNIYGVGLVAATSFTLGAGNATVILHSDGTNWSIVSGQRDTGWVTLSLVNSWTAAAGQYVPAIRLIGDRVWVRGGFNGGGAGLSACATLPVGYRPAATVTLDPALGMATVSTAGVMSLSTGGSWGLDGASFSLT